MWHPALLPSSVRNVFERRPDKAKTGDEAEFTGVNEHPSACSTQHGRVRMHFVQSLALDGFFT